MCCEYCCPVPPHDSDDWPTRAELEEMAAEDERRRAAALRPWREGGWDLRTDLFPPSAHGARREVGYE